MKRLIGNFLAPGVKMPAPAPQQPSRGLAFIKTRRIGGQCFHCGKTGHMARDCKNATQVQKDVTYKNSGNLKT